MISIGIPTVNGAHRLERCLSHIFKDDSVSRFDAEVIVVDDGSSEYCLEKNREYCQKFNVKLVEHGERRGVPKAWNTLVRNSQYELIILLNDDIEVNKDWIDVIEYTLRKNPWIGMAGLMAIEGNRPNEFPIFPTYVESKILKGSLDSEIIAARGYAFGFRKQDWKDIGGFDERYFCFFEEVDFGLSLLIHKKLRSVMLSYPFCHHYHGETTRTVLSDVQNIFEESKLAFENKWNFKWEDLRKNITSDKFYISRFDDIKEWNSNLKVWG